MKELINIESKQDLEKLLLAIIEDKEIEIKEVKPIAFNLRFKGEKFKVNNGYISADFADLLVTFKKDYREFLVTTIGKSKARETEIFFKVEDGSIQLDFLNDLPKEIWEQINKMTGKQISITLIIAILAYFSSSSWQNYLDTQKETLKIYLDSKNKSDAFEIASNAIDILKENKKLEVRKNRPIKTAIEMLSTNEELEIQTDETKKELYNETDAEKFAYDEEEKDTITKYNESFNIKGFTKETYGWNIKIESHNKEMKPKTFWATSKLLPENNIKLFEDADNNKARKLEVTVVKNKGKVTEAYITNLIIKK
ncbi:hypothetical protein [Arcobacter sp. F2176]|uniref:hypothetical protein n=1 Tax=Arcobacter sp. F2176 TaxID=2044511 RepID=UPI00100B4EB7|nr:hypothetical protein [Arcobacter sp. F2176]RXJ81041.1 hypothetical protein CRU95_08980 [Arcobacter sp. F2176]